MEDGHTDLFKSKEEKTLSLETGRPGVEPQLCC